MMKTIGHGSLKNTALLCSRSERKTLKKRTGTQLNTKAIESVGTPARQTETGTCVVDVDWLWCAVSSAFESPL
jgi:hypothetical protein